MKKWFFLSFLFLTHAYAADQEAGPATQAAAAMEVDPGQNQEAIDLGKFYALSFEDREKIIFDLKLDEGFGKTFIETDYLKATPEEKDQAQQFLDSLTPEQQQAVLCKKYGAEFLGMDVDQENPWVPKMLSSGEFIPLDALKKWEKQAVGDDFFLTLETRIKIPVDEVNRLRTLFGIVDDAKARADLATFKEYKIIIGDLINNYMTGIFQSPQEEDVKELYFYLSSIAHPWDEESDFFYPVTKRDLKRYNDQFGNPENQAFQPFETLEAAQENILKNIRKDNICSELRPIIKFIRRLPDTLVPAEEKALFKRLNAWIRGTLVLKSSVLEPTAVYLEALENILEAFEKYGKMVICSKGEGHEGALGALDQAYQQFDEDILDEKKYFLECITWLQMIEIMDKMDEEEDEGEVRYKEFQKNLKEMEWVLPLNWRVATFKGTFLSDNDVLYNFMMVFHQLYQKWIAIRDENFELEDQDKKDLFDKTVHVDWAALKFGGDDDQALPKIVFQLEVLKELFEKQEAVTIFEACKKQLADARIQLEEHDNPICPAAQAHPFYRFLSSEQKRALENEAWFLLCLIKRKYPEIDLRAFPGFMSLPGWMQQDIIENGQYYSAEQLMESYKLQIDQLYISGNLANFNPQEMMQSQKVQYILSQEQQQEIITYFKDLLLETIKWPVINEMQHLAAEGNLGMDYDVLMALQSLDPSVTQEEAVGVVRELEELKMGLLVPTLDFDPFGVE